MQGALRSGFCGTFLTLSTGLSVFGQGPGGPGQGNEAMRRANQLDIEGKGAEARVLFQKLINGAATPAEKASAWRAMAMSWAFENNCEKTTEYENKVIEYWKTQESSSPDRAFYQQGEMANEAARVCIEAGSFDDALDLYRRGRELGLKEPNIPAGRRDLWDYRWEHAQARVAARKETRQKLRSTWPLRQRCSIA